MFLVCVWRHRGSHRCVWTRAHWMATQYLGGISDLPMAERDILANAYQGTCRVSRTWPRWRLNRDAPSRRETWKCTAQCTSSTEGIAILSSCWPSSSFEVVANEKKKTNHMGIFHMYAETSNDDRTEMQLKFHDSWNPSVLITTPTAGSTGLNCTAANHVVITRKL